MGAIFSRFRKEKTTYELLENLEEKIRDIEEYTITTQQRQKRFVANFLVISIGLYVISFAVFYFVFFPPTWNERIIHSLPLLICPMIITLIKKVLAWYFEQKVVSNTNELKVLRAQKKKILEKVMDKETYKVAVDILNKFGDKPPKTSATQDMSGISPMKAPQPMAGTPKGPVPARTAHGPQSAPTQQQMTPMRPQMQPNTPMGVNANMRLPNPNMQTSFHQPQSAGPNPQSMPYRRTPYPIINHSEKGVIEKMVDYLVGDGPSSRFAMICQHCLMHNGMALQEEYEYSPFRCAFCGVYNHAKKQRPLAPKLPFEVALAQKKLKAEESEESAAEGSASEETLAESEQLTPDQGEPQEDEMPEADMATNSAVDDPSDEVPQAGTKSD